MPRAHRLFRLAVTALTVGFATAALAQVPPSMDLDIAIDLDSGYVASESADRSVIYSEVLTIPDVSWVRVHFDFVSLAAPPIGGQPTILRITSLFDGAQQHHTHETLRQWGQTSAYFNGNSILLEIISDPDTGTSRLKASKATAGTLTPALPLTICDGTDDRQLSSDPAVGRVEPIGCTVWLIQDIQGCMLGAGHCSFPDSNYGVVEFNVPLSDGGGNPQHPGPEDQYAIDGDSLLHRSQGTGEDWSYHGCFPNTETGLTPFEAQGAAFPLAATPPPAGGEVTITGYGSTSPPVPPQWNGAQKTLTGPFVQSNPGTTIRYRVDTTGGNSGSPVFHEDTGLAIGVHTNGGCGNNGDGMNTGTSIDSPELAAALDEPAGICEYIPPPMNFIFPNGRPDVLHPDGDTVRIEVEGEAGPVPGTGFVHYRIGKAGAFNNVPMTVIGPNVYDAVFPAVDCETPVNYFVSAENAEGVREFFPAGVPIAFLRAVSGTGLDNSFADDFEMDEGWTVSGDAAAGAWIRGVPNGNGFFGDPLLDQDGSSQCFITGLMDLEDVDSGSTILTSPVFDATNGDTHVTFWRWYANTFGDNPASDTMLVEISDDDGGTWTSLDTYGPAGGTGLWRYESYRVTDFVTATATVRVRFTARDLGDDSAIEAGIDTFRVNGSASGVTCGACPGDLDGSGVVDVDDLLLVLGAFGTGDGGDGDGDGDTDIDDLLLVLANFGSC